MVSEYNIRLNPNCAAAVNTGLKFKSGDKGIIFRIAVEELDTTGTTAKIVFWRANGTSVESDITGADGIYSYKTLGNEFALPGKTVADVKIYSGDDRVSTASFVFEVGVDTMDGLGAGTGGYSDRLEQLVSEAEEAGAMTEQAKVDLQSATANLNATEKDMEATVQNFKDAYGEVGALNPRGNWSSSTEYQIRDVVYHNSFSWICLVQNTGKEPSTANAAYWQQMTDLQSIISGTTTVGNANKLDGHDSNYFATAQSVTDIVNGTTTVGNSASLGGETSEAWQTKIDNTTAALANYLPLSGGKVEAPTGDTPLKIKTNGSDATYLGFVNKQGKSNYIGFNSNGEGVLFGKGSILHTGNSAKVAIQSTAPSDTSALWVDTTNKVIKAYIDGAWTQVS